MLVTIYVLNPNHLLLCCICAISLLTILRKGPHARHENMKRPNAPVESRSVSDGDRRCYPKLESVRLGKLSCPSRVLVRKGLLSSGGTWSREGHSRGWRSSCRRRRKSWEGKLQQPWHVSQFVTCRKGDVDTYHVLAGDIADLPASLVGSARVGTGLAAAGSSVEGSGSGHGGDGGNGNSGELHVCGWWFLVLVFKCWASVACCSESSSRRRWLLMRMMRIFDLEVISKGLYTWFRTYWVCLLNICFYSCEYGLTYTRGVKFRTSELGHSPYSHDTILDSPLPSTAGEVVSLQHPAVLLVSHWITLPIRGWLEGCDVP